MPEGRLRSININAHGGVPKLPVQSVQIHSSGVEGDRQRDLRFHGGPDRAVSLYSLERIAALRREGHPILPGSTGENLTVSGLDWPSLQPGKTILVGSQVLLQVTGYASPCRNIAASFEAEEFSRISQKVHPGWSRVYTRVLQEGRVAEGDAVVLNPPRDLQN